MSQKSHMLLSSAKIFEASSTNSVDTEQTGLIWVHTVCSILMLTNKETILDVVILLMF